MTLQAPPHVLGFSPANEPPRLLRSLTLTHAILYGLGVTIGAGIYVLVGVAAGRSGMHAPLAFLAAAIAMSFTAASFAELGTRMPVSASEAAYVDAAFNRRWLSLGMGLLVIAAAAISGATISAGSAGYIRVFLDLPQFWVIAGVVAAMGAIACLATTQSVRFAGAMTLIEIGGLLLIVLAGFGQEGGQIFARLPELVPALDDPGAWKSVGATTLLAVFAFIGFEHLVNISEEMKEPSHTLPRALFVTLAITSLLYIVVTWVALIAVPPDQLARSEAPLAMVFQRLTGLPITTMSAIAIVATLNGIVVHVIMIARVLYGIASKGDLPKMFASVSPITHTPLVATFTAIAAIMFLALAVPLDGLAAWASRGTLVIFAGINIALIRIKSREPTPSGAFRCPLPVAYLGLLSSAALLGIDVAA